MDEGQGKDYFCISFHKHQGSTFRFPMCACQELTGLKTPRHPAAWCPRRNVRQDSSIRQIQAKGR
jgi:hypothetical protein